MERSVPLLRTQPAKNLRLWLVNSGFASGCNYEYDEMDKPLI